MDTNEVRKEACAYLLASAQTTQRAADSCLDSILAAAQVVTGCLYRGGKLLICGNGGSAADCQHLAGELVSLLNKTHLRPAIAAIALTTDTSILTAISNDFGYGGVFERQVEALGRPGDVLLGISTSGNSENVLRAFRQANAQGMKTIGLTGESGGKLKALADVAICIPSEDVQHIQEAHLAVEHLLSALVERQLFGAQTT